MEYKNIIFEKKDGIGYVTMNRPKALERSEYRGSYGTG